MPRHFYVSDRGSTHKSSSSLGPHVFASCQGHWEGLLCVRHTDDTSVVWLGVCPSEYLWRHVAPREYGDAWCLTLLWWTVFKGNKVQKVSSGHQGRRWLNKICGAWGTISGRQNVHTHTQWHRIHHCYCCCSWFIDLYDGMVVHWSKERNQEEAAPRQGRCAALL